MYGYGPPPGWMGYPTREPTLAELIENNKTLEDIRKDVEEKIKKKKEEDKPKPVVFSFLECLSLITIAGFVAGPFVGYLYLSLLLGFIQKYAIIAPLLK